MVRMMSHDDAAELLGAYALDAVEPDEVEAIEEHLRTCPRCRDELQAHREVVGVLAYPGQEAPDGMWDRVAERIHDAGSGDPDRPVRLLPMADPAARAGRRAPRTTIVMSALAAAAVVVVALLGLDVARLQNRTNHLSHEVASMTGQPTMADVTRARSIPGARSVKLSSPAGGGPTLDAVILPGGQGYLYGSKLTPLVSSQTYQLWGVVGNQRISYGVLGADLSAVMSFRAGSGVVALAVTEEVAGGVVSTVHQPVAVGAVT
jgi:hypothetical protein